MVSSFSTSRFLIPGPTWLVDDLNLDCLLDKVDRTDEPELAEVKVVELQVSRAELPHS